MGIVSLIVDSRPCVLDGHHEEEPESHRWGIAAQVFALNDSVYPSVVVELLIHGRVCLS